MLNFTADEVLQGVEELAQMMMDDSLTFNHIKEFKQALLEGLTIKEAQSRVVYNNTF